MGRSKNTKLLDFEYATYRSQIQDYFVEEVLTSPVTILDPMAGTAPLIPFFETHGHKAYLSDLLPIHYHINRMKLWRSKESFNEYGSEKIKRRLMTYLKPLNRKRTFVSTDWIDETILDIFVGAWNQAEDEDEYLRAVLRGLIILCIKPYSSFSKSSNPTWIKIGGITTDRSVSEVISENMDLIRSFYANYPSLEEEGECHLGIGDAASFKMDERADLIMTSPPYCNRLDYANSYSPELQFLSRVGYPTPRERLIGTNVVKDYGTLEEDLQRIGEASQYISDFLGRIRNMKFRDTSYYLRYFARYFAGLFLAFENLLSYLSDSGRMYIVIQDNLHRGELIELDVALSEMLEKKGYDCRVVERFERHHLGRRNISKYHRVVYIRQYEKILLAGRDLR